jgi:hypothetical protein
MKSIHDGTPSQRPGFAGGKRCRNRQSASGLPTSSRCRLPASQPWPPVKKVQTTSCSPDWKSRRLFIQRGAGLFWFQKEEKWTQLVAFPERRTLPDSELLPIIARQEQKGGCGFQDDDEAGKK